MTNCIISHLAPRDAKRRSKRDPPGKRAKRLKHQTKKHNGRKPRKPYLRNKYMDHVLSYINEEASAWDEIYHTRIIMDATFDNVYHMANLRGVHMLQFLFTRAQITAACEKEFANVIKPNLTEEKFINLDINRLHMWCKVGKHCDLSLVTHDLNRYHSVFSKFSKEQLLGWNAVMKSYPELYAWEKTGYGRKSVLGEKVAFTVDDARNFVALVKSHSLSNKIHWLTPVFEDRTWNERINNYYHEACDTRWRVSKCAECDTELWNSHMQAFSRTQNKHGLTCGKLHCLDCVVKVLKENQERKRPLFSCGKDCNCFLQLDQVETKKSYAYFSGKLDMTEEAICTTIAENFETCVLAPYRLLPEQIVAKQDVHTHAQTHRILDQLCTGDHMDTLSEETKEEVSKVSTKVRNLIRMGRLHNASKLLNSATKQVVSATIAKNDEEMLSSVKDLIDPIRSVLNNRPDSTEDLPDLFGMSMLDIANASLQRAKDAAQTAFSIAKQCAICTEVVSQRGDNEDLMTLHDDLEKEVAEWGMRFSAPCHACKDCFGNYLNFKQSLGKPMLRCPGMNCRCFLDKKKVKAAMPNAFAEYKTAMMRFSLKRVENYRTCPNADCAHGIVLDNCCNVDEVTCTACDTSFCPNCNDEPHEGMTCEEFQRKRHAERWGEAKDYMKNETKQCPYCLVWIEKNGGCNHMTCHHCRGEFCWLCFGEWHSHNSCTEKKPVTRRPFNELFPNWQEKNKTLKARFHVGKYVTVEPHTDEYVGRVVSTHDNGIYHIEAVQIPEVDSKIKKTLIVEESLVRGYNKHIPAANAEAFEEETYSSFLAGFEVDETTEKPKDISVELTLTSAVELTTKDATKDASDSESGDSTFDDGDLPFFSFMKGFDDSDDEDSEFGDLLAKLNDIDNVVYYENSHKLMQGNVGLKTLRERKKLRAAREKIREGVQDVSCDSDDEESEIYPAWLLFMNANDEMESESEIEDETASICVQMTFDDDSSSEDLGFESDDEEESS